MEDKIKGLEAGRGGMEWEAEIRREIKVRKSKVIGD